MMMKHMHVVVLGAAAVLWPLAAMSQVDPNQAPGSPSNPNNPANGNNPSMMNQPSGPPGTSNSTGAPTTPGSTSTSMRDSLGAPGMTGQQMADKEFLRKAAEGGVAEVQLGKLASQKAGAQEVKDFGQKMVDDHTTINKEMAAVADAMGVMLPKKMKKEDQAEYDKLNGLSGDAFDKEYLLYMVMDHRMDFREFRMESTTAGDPALAAEVTKAMGVIREHLMMVSKLATDKGVPLPPRPQRPTQTPPAGQ